MNRKSPEYEICACKKVTRAQLEAFIKESKIYDLKELCIAAKVGKACGGCREDIENLIQDVLNETND